MYKMKSHCLKWTKDTENINRRVSKTINGERTILNDIKIRNMW